MRILFDPQAFNESSYGMYRYYLGLYQGLSEAGVEVICPIRESVIIGDIPQKKSTFERLPLTWQRRVRRVQKNLIRKRYYEAISKSRFDLLYITSCGFETQFLKYLSNKPFVMTVHDTMHMVSTQYTFFDQGSDYDSLGYLAHLAERTACVSDHTRNDLCQKYYLDPNKTQTVYPYNFLSPDAEDVEHLPDSYILFVGVRSGRKNFFEWLKAIAGYLSEHPDLKMVVAGQLKESEVFFSKKLGIDKQFVSYQAVTDSQLNTLYRNALCLAFPSLYEGFGLPVLEAMANGCPVITSNHSSLPEVAGSAAVLVDPLDNEIMLNALKKIHQNQDFRKALIKKGLEQSKKFSKQNFIKGMVNLFEQAIRSYSNQLNL